MTDAFGEDEIDRRFGHLGAVTPLAALRLGRPELDAWEMGEVVATARELLASYYVHLPLKRALYAIDPLGRLELMANRLDEVRRGYEASLPERELHRELGSIFASLRDLHTTYTLPEPHRSRIAFLPFLVEACDDGDGPRFLVTKVQAAFADPDFGPSVRVTHWNGVPIATAVDLHSERTGGSNRAARRARGVERLTFRWMGRAAGPDEYWVTVTYEVAGERRHLRFGWLVVERSAPGAGGRERRPALTLGRDREGEWIGDVKRRLYATPARWSRGPWSDVLAFRTLERPDDPHRYGYLRLFSFAVPPGRVAGYVAAVRRLVAAAPAGGLIVDVRGNPGGDIVAAERVLQLLSPVPISPEPLDFRSTPRAAALAEAVYAERGVATAFDAMRREASSTAAQYLPSPPFEPREAYNDIGQVYQGPVVLLVDALSYSAADVFAAGFQDHRLGTVLGTDAQTGGGGGNVWPYAGVRRLGASELPRRLPHDASFDVAVRRTTRVGPRAGVVLEDRGVVADGAPVPLTTGDVLGENADLLRAAMAVLDDPSRRHGLRVTYRRRERHFALRAENLGRVEIVLDGLPLAGVRAPDGARVEVPAEAGEPQAATFLGYATREAGGRPVVSVRWRSRSVARPTGT